MLEVDKIETIVVKVGTSTITYENGKANLRRIEQLCEVLSDLQNAGRKIILVSSGAVGVGVGKMNLSERPRETAKRQALAAIGQCELMFMYERFFGEFSNNIAQVLLTRDDIENQYSRLNVVNTFNALLDMNVIPIVNENDTVAIYEIEGAKIGDNDALSAIVADITGADALIILTDIDGLYDRDPRKNPGAVRIEMVEEITENIVALAGGTGSNRGTGGMSTKIAAARLATENGIDCIVCSGNDPRVIYSILEGNSAGTLFKARK